jgi:hypothetical protein
MEFVQLVQTARKPKLRWQKLRVDQCHFFWMLSELVAQKCLDKTYKEEAVSK